MRRLVYFVTQAIGSVKAAPGVSLLAAGTMAATLLLAGLYVMTIQNLQGLALVWGRTAALNTYLNDAVSAEQALALSTTIAHFPEVARAQVVSPGEALARFRARGPEAALLVADVDDRVLPTSIQVDLKPDAADLTTLATLAERLGDLAGVAEVDYGQQEFARLQALLEVLRYGGLAGGFLVLLATMFIVANTIRLTVYARRDEIAILRLVGATAWFIRAPFVLEGALWGLVGGGTALGLAWLADWLLAERLTLAVADVLGGLRIQLFDLAVTVPLLALGIVLGILGSAIAVGRFLAEEEG